MVDDGPHARLVRVADLKSRRSRFERVRAEVQAKPGEPVHIIEYLKPGVEELAALLPRGLSGALTRWAARRGLTHKLNVGMYVQTTSVFGFLTLRFLASLRRLRRITGRYHEEKSLIDRWLAAVRSAGSRDLALALEVALCGRLIKGYGDTHERGLARFAVLRAAWRQPAADAGRLAALRAESLASAPVGEAPGPSSTSPLTAPPPGEDGVMGL